MTICTDQGKYSIANIFICMHWHLKTRVLNSLGYFTFFCSVRIMTLTYTTKTKSQNHKNIDTITTTIKFYYQAQHPIEGEGLLTNCCPHIHFSAKRDEQSSRQFGIMSSQHVNPPTIVGFLDCNYCYKSAANYPNSPW